MRAFEKMKRLPGGVASNARSATDWRPRYRAAAFRFRASQRAKSARPRLEDRLGHRFVGEADLPRAPRVERLAGQDQVERRRQPHDARQARAAAPGREDPELDLRQADLGLLRVRHDAVVAGEGELGAAAEARAVDRGDGRVRQVRELLEERLHARDERAHVLGLHVEEFADVGSRR